MLTMREHLNAIVDLSVRLKAPTNCGCAACQINAHALDALRILDAADRFNNGFSDVPGEDDILMCDPERDS